MINAIWHSSGKAGFKTAPNLVKGAKNAAIVSSSPLFTPTQGADKKSSKITNTVQMSYFDGDIWLYPLSREIDFEIVLTPKEFTLELHNTSQSPTTLVSITSLDSSIELGISAPLEFTGLQARQFYIRALGNGGLDIDTIIIFRFTTQTIWLSIRGSRAIILTAPPMHDYTESHSFYTDIFMAQSSRERRQAIVTKPKREVSYSINTKDDNQRIYLENMMRFAMEYSFLQPLYFSKTKATATSSGQVIVCDTSTSDFRVGEMLLCLKPDRSYLSAKIIGYNATSVTVDKTLEVTKGDSIYPLLNSSATSSNSFTRLTKEATKWSITLKEIL